MQNLQFLLQIIIDHSLLENRREGRLHVSHISCDRRRWSTVRIGSHLESRGLLFTFDGTSANDLLNWIFLVHWESGNSTVVTFLGWIRWSESFIMLSIPWCCHPPWLWFDFLFDIKHFFTRIENTTSQSPAILGEWLILQFAFMI